MFTSQETKQFPLFSTEVQGHTNLPLVCSVQERHYPSELSTTSRFSDCYGAKCSGGVFVSMVIKAELWLQGNS
jgi:hypothetical protein